MAIDISIIIVSWNVCDRLQENLKALFENCRDIEFEVFIVDNNSHDDTVLMIEKNYPLVKIIKNDKNLGFARANNQGIKLAQGRYILLLNPDMRTELNTVKCMVEWMDNNPKAGVAGCHLIDENGKTIKHIRRFPMMSDQLAVILKIPHLYPKVLNQYLCMDFDYTKEQEVDQVRGSFFMIRKEVIKKIGGLDERYFIWFEEVDYCRQVKLAGWKVMYTPAAQCIDYVGQSFSKIASFKKQCYFRDSMLKYFKKWHSFSEYFILYIFWPFAFLITAIFLIFKKNNE
ncbi:MAG: glycosyltransferase family 2 protein [Candidatus Falkowbacteria bacterium]|nr:glycosyltransferase family 2 protein [Candidatus Falkowbacteria bacterium]